MTDLKRLYLKKFNFWLFLIQFSSHVFTGQREGTQQTPTSQMATGWDPAAWAGASPSALYGSGMSGLLGSPSSSINLNLSDFVDMSTSTQHNTGIWSTPSAAAGSAAQLHDEGQQLFTERDSARDDVTEHERDQWYFFESIQGFAIFLKVFVCYLFESIRLLFVWKYSFAICLICLKVFVWCNDSRCHCDICYYGQSELWTMNC